LGGIGNLHAGNVGKTAIIILVIWLFAVVTGLSPSVTRASVMISFVMTGKLFNRHINTHNILFASAFVLLAFSPALLADVSFQLSFAAVWGIIMYQPAMYRIFVFKNLPADRIWKLFTVSCAAQLSTLPLTLYYFHQFPVYFWLANLFIVPLVSVIICIAAVFLLVSVIQPFALVLGKILAILLDFLYRSVSFTEMLPGALIENIRISSQQVILLYTGILLMYMFIHYRKYAFLMSSCVLFLFFQVLNLIHNLEIKNQRIFQVGNVKGSSAICFISGRDCIIWGDSTLYYRQNHMQYALEGYLIERGVAGSVKLLSGHTPDQTDISESPNLFYRTPWLGKNCFFEFSGQRIVWLQDDQIYTCHSVQQLKVDIVIVSGRLTPDLWAVTPALNTDLIILDSSVGRFAARKWKYACKKQGIPCWDVGEKGSYWKQHGKGPNLSKNQPLPSPDGQ
jgi:competence protein ComEC